VAPRIDVVRISGEWIRHAPHRSDLLGRSAEAIDGRWQRGGIVRRLYLAAEPATAIAEWYRWLAERGLPPTHAIPHDHHAWELDIELADLRATNQLKALGLNVPIPGRRTWPPYQPVGERLWRDGWAGLITRSAARADAFVVCVFAAQWPPPGCAPTRAIEITDVPAPPSGMTT
jgi:hypothetical protein